ncbi:MAG: TonB-dependent receptor [Bacteroidales bacterium]|nr:TonB-dependent receptor [Bacteroidales bacterium]
MTASGIELAILLTVSAVRGTCVDAQPSERADTLGAARVSDTRGGRSRLDSGVPTLRVGSAALERSGARDLAEVLRTLPGLNVKDYGGIGGLKTVSVRGLGAAHTALCSDGFLLTDIQQGAMDLSAFDLDDTGSIDVEIGTPDELFSPAGSFPAGSALRISPKALDFGDGPLKTSAGIGWGSFNSWKPRVRVEGRLAPGWGVSARASWLRSDGDYPFHDAKVISGGASSAGNTLRREGADVSVLKTGLRLEGNTRRGGTLTAGADWTSSERGLPGAVIYYTQNPTERLWDRDLSLRSAYERTAGGWRFRAGGFFRQHFTRYTNDDALYPTPLDDRYLQRHLGASGIVQRGIPLGPAGRELRLALAQDLSFASLAADMMACPDPQRLSSVSALNLQYRSERLTATAGVAATYVHEQSRKPDASVQTAPDRSRLSPSASLSWLAAKGLHLRAFIKDGFRVPTFNDLYYDHFGTIHLVPEKAFQTGAGAAWQVDAGAARLSFTADAYYNRVRDKIIAVPTLFVWHMRNLGRVDMKGADLSASAFVPLWGKYAFRAEANWSVLDAVDLSKPEAKNYGYQIEYTPFNSGAACLSLSSRTASLSYTLCAVGRRWYLPQNIAANEMPAYFDHSLAVRKDFRVHAALLSLAAEALNLTDVNYEIVRSYPMPGRQFRLSLQITI